MPASKRLFVALELPRELIAALQELNPQLPGLRWVSPEQMHLTLSFLGEVAVSDFVTLTAALGEVRVPPFVLPLGGMGSFEVRGRPSVVWVGVGKGHPHLFALHKQIQDAVLRAGLEPDLKAFRPHVTVGRVRDLSREALQPFLRRHRELEFGLFRVSGFALFSSVLNLDGASHEVELRVAFPAPSA